MPLSNLALPSHLTPPELYSGSADASGHGAATDATDDVVAGAADDAVVVDIESEFLKNDSLFWVRTNIQITRFVAMFVAQRPHVRAGSHGDRFEFSEGQIHFASECL